MSGEADIYTSEIWTLITSCAQVDKDSISSLSLHSANMKNVAGFGASINLSTRCFYVNFLWVYFIVFASPDTSFIASS